jgi:hypothetical protein
MIKATQNNWVRVAVYVAFATGMWLSTLMASSALIAPALTLTITAACYRKISYHI